MKKNKKKVIEEFLITDFASEGKCIGRVDGEVVFVDGGNICPGDVVKVVIQKSKKKYSEGRILAFVEKSKDRIEPFCSHFGTCGGCKWQHIPYENQLAQKQKQVYDQLTRIGKIKDAEFLPILASDKTTFYRNKLEFTFANSRWLTAEEILEDELKNKDALGFHIPKRFDKVLQIDKCYLQSDLSNEIRDFLKIIADESEFDYYDHKIHKGFFRNLIIRTTSIGECMVVLQIAENNLDKIEMIMEKIKNKFPQITSLNYIINQKGNDSYFDLNPVLYAGKAFITEKMENLEFRIGVKSFYQTNSEQAHNLYKIVKEFANINKEELVYDLYTGTGTIALFIANKAKKVIGIEYIEAAIEDAKINAQVNGIENSEFFAGDMAKILNVDFLNKNGYPDTVIVDPPRAGLDKAVCEVLLLSNAKKIVYVSCNPSTQARDIELLSEKYEVSKVNAVDMFPHTFHVENVALLELV